MNYLHGPPATQRYFITYVDVWIRLQDWQCVAWDRFPIRHLLWGSLLTSHVGSSYLNICGRKNKYAPATDSRGCVTMMCAVKNSATESQRTKNDRARVAAYQCWMPFSNNPAHCTPVFRWRSQEFKQWAGTVALASL